MNLRDIFIIMPFGAEEIKHKGTEKKYSQDHFDDIYILLKDAVEEFDKTINVDRMEQKHGNLVNAIIKRLSISDCVIAVLSGKNPNVFYELGIRHSLRQNTIMLVEDYDEYPFDLNSYFSFKYSLNNEKNRRALKDFIKQRLSEISGGEKISDSPVLDVLESSEYEQIKALNSLELIKSANIIHGLVHEIFAVQGVLMRGLEDLHGGAKIRKIGITNTIMEGFVQNRLLPGFPNDSYLDAEEVLNDWRIFERIWNDLVDRDEDPGEAPNLEIILASSNRKLVAFSYDLLNASKSIFNHGSPFLSYWGNSIDSVSESMPTTKHLMRANEKILPLLLDEAKRLKEYFTQQTIEHDQKPDTLSEFIGGS